MCSNVPHISLLRELDLFLEIYFCFDNFQNKSEVVFVINGTLSFESYHGINKIIYLMVATLHWKLMNLILLFFFT